MDDQLEELQELMQKSNELSYTDSRKSLELAGELYEKAKANQAHEYLYESLFIKGVSHNQLGESQEAITALSQAHYIALLHFPDDAQKHSSINNMLGIIYQFQYRLEIALDYYLQALKYNVPKHKTSLYNNLATIYSRKEDFETSLHYTESALNRSKKENNAFATASLLYNSIASFTKLKNIAKAEKRLASLEDIMKKNKDSDPQFQHMIPQVSMAKALILIEKQDYKTALQYLDQFAEELNSLNLEIYLVSAYQKKAEIYQKLNKSKKAIACAIQALEYAQQFDLYYEQRKILALLIEHYKEEKNWKKALAYTETLQQLAHSSFEAVRENDFRQIISDRENIINHEGEVQEQLKEQDALIQQFSHVISHDLKEPLRNIVSFSNLLKRRYGQEIDQEGKEFVESISQGANKVNENLIRLLEYTSLKPALPHNIQRSTLTSIISQIQETYTHLVAPQQLIIDFPPSAFIIMCKEHATQLWDEMIGNAVKFRKPDEDCNIQIQFFTSEHQLEYIITDYGIGLDMRYKDDIFQIFNQLKPDVQGAGMGLPICERILKLYQGKIYVTGEVNQYMSVHIQIPIEKNLK